MKLLMICFLGFFGYQLQAQVKSPDAFSGSFSPTQVIAPGSEIDNWTLDLRVSGHTEKLAELKSLNYTCERKITSYYLCRKFIRNSAIPAEVVAKMLQKINPNQTLSFGPVKDRNGRVLVQNPVYAAWQFENSVGYDSELYPKYQVRWNQGGWKLAIYRENQSLVVDFQIRSLKQLGKYVHAMRQVSEFQMREYHAINLWNLVQR